VIHPSIQLFLEELALLHLARFLIAFDGSFRVPGQGADEDQHGTQHKGRDHQDGEIRGNDLPAEKMEIHICGIEKGEPAKERDNDQNDDQQQSN
jgi:hypothetical protein